MLSANTVAQKPGGNVLPPLSSTQGRAAAADVPRASCATDGEALSSSIASIRTVIAARDAAQLRRKSASLFTCIVFLAGKSRWQQSASRLREDEDDLRLTRRSGLPAIAAIGAIL